MILNQDQKNALIQAAIDCRHNAYAPYSNYQVGAALLLDDDTIFTGVNVENASYGLTNCAERSAIFSMVSAGKRPILAMAVATDNGGSPCGACRQVLAEFAGDIPIFLCDNAGNCRQTSLFALLPDHFSPDHLS